MVKKSEEGVDLDELGYIDSQYFGTAFSFNFFNINPVFIYNLLKSHHLIAFLLKHTCLLTRHVDFIEKSIAFVRAEMLPLDWSSVRACNLPLMLRRAHG